MICKACGGVVSDKASFCKTCGAPVERQAEQQESNQSLPDLQTQPIQTATVAIDGAMQPEPKSDGPNKRLIAIIVGIVAVVAIAGGIAAFALLGGGPGGNPNAASESAAAQEQKTGLEASVQYAGNLRMGTFIIPSTWTVKDASYTSRQTFLTYSDPASKAGDIIEISDLPLSYSEALKELEKESESSRYDEYEFEETAVGDCNAIRMHAEDGDTTYVMYVIEVESNLLIGIRAAFADNDPADFDKWMETYTPARRSDSGTQWAGSDSVGYVELPAYWFSADQVMTQNLSSNETYYGGNVVQDDDNTFMTIGLEPTSDKPELLAIVAETSAAQYGDEVYRYEKGLLNGHEVYVVKTDGYDSDTLFTCYFIDNGTTTTQIDIVYDKGSEIDTDALVESYIASKSEIAKEDTRTGFTDMEELEMSDPNDRPTESNTLGLKLVPKSDDEVLTASSLQGSQSMSAFSAGGTIEMALMTKDGDYVMGMYLDGESIANYPDGLDAMVDETYDAFMQMGLDQDLKLSKGKVQMAGSEEPYLYLDLTALGTPMSMLQVYHVGPDGTIGAIATVSTDEQTAKALLDRVEKL